MHTVLIELSEETLLMRPLNFYEKWEPITDHTIFKSITCEIVAHLKVAFDASRNL